MQCNAMRDVTSHDRTYDKIIQYMTYDRTTHSSLIRIKRFKRTKTLTANTTTQPIKRQTNDFIKLHFRLHSKRKRTIKRHI